MVWTTRTFQGQRKTRWFSFGGLRTFDSAERSCGSLGHPNEMVVSGHSLENHRVLDSAPMPVHGCHFKVISCLSKSLEDAQVQRNMDHLFGSLNHHNKW
ncbi:hypothetical protein FKM82_029356 [Ascaphus truei]